MSHNPKEAEKEMKKAIFISADCWLEVFDLLPPSQLGLGIALISHRFDFYVDEHFKTRRWSLANKIRIRRKIGENGAKEMLIVNSYGKALPIPQNPLPSKVMAFRSIKIVYIDQNVLTFLRPFQRFSATFETKLTVATANILILEFVVLNIWPMLGSAIHLLIWNNVVAFGRMRKLAPSMLNDCQSLHFMSFDDGILPKFPPDDSANATDGQAVAKWLFSPRADNLWKVLKIEESAKCSAVEKWLATVEQIKAAFSNASSPANFSIIVHFTSFNWYSFTVPFELINRLTGEQLTLTEDANHFTLIRSPIVPDDKRQQQQKMEQELDDRWNQIDILIADGALDIGLPDAAVSSPGPSGQQQQQKMNCLIG